MVESELPPASQGDTPPTTRKEPSTPHVRKASGFRTIPRDLLGGKDTKKKMREMTGNEVDSRAVEMSYDDFMSTFLPCAGDETKEAEEIQAIVTKIGNVPEILKAVRGQETNRYSPLMDLIQPAWDGTDYVARNVCHWSEKSELKVKMRPDIACYKKNKDGLTDFDLRNKSPSDPNKNPKSCHDGSTPQNPVDTRDLSGNGTTTSGSPDVDLGSDVSVQTTTITQSATDSKEKSRVLPQYPPFAARMDYTGCKLTIEDKTNSKRSSFNMTAGSIRGFLPGGTERIHARGQIGEHTSAIMERQHRTHLLSVVTVTNMARFLHWDRGGVVVSKPIAFDEDLTSFIKFFYRFARMSPEDQGEDLSVLKPSDDDMKALKDFETKQLPDLVENHREFFKEAFLTNTAKFPVVKIELDKMSYSSSSPPSQIRRSDVPAEKMHLLIGAPRTNAYSPFGRGTKGFIAFDLEEKRLKFVKDCWRYDGDTYHPELDTYYRLKTRIKGPTTGLAMADGGGDVFNSKGQVQTTSTDRYLRKGSSKKYLPQVHYRFSTRRVGTPLEKYKGSSRNLCTYVAQAMDGHGRAWVDAEVIHRDVSPENILIDEDPEGGSRDTPEGFIHDWDLCKYKEELNAGPAQSVRSGTWPFVSALLLYYPGKQHELSDDLESFIHVIHWFCLRFHRHNLTDKFAGIASTLSGVYFACTKANGYDVGGDLKIELMKTGQLCFTPHPTVNQGLQLLLEELSNLCKQHYASIDFAPLDQLRAETLGYELPSVEDKLQPSQKNPKPVVSHLSRWGKIDFGSRKKTASPSTVIPSENSNKTDAIKPPNKPLKPISPFTNHNAIIATFYGLLDDDDFWPTNDKIHDQFSSVLSEHMSLTYSTLAPASSIPPNAKKTSKHSNGKRSASAALGEGGPSQKRSRTSGQTGTRTNVQSATHAGMHSKKSQSNVTRESHREPTVPEVQEPEPTATS
ncbi:hypothetical protein ABKN59_004888 [Abortiporus biennis]